MTATSHGVGADWDRLIERLSRRFTVARTDASQLEALCAFFQRAYADQPVAAAFQDAARIRQRWRWVNEQNPVPLDGHVPAWVCLNDGEIIGHFAALPVTAVVQGQAVPICWGRDLIVAPAFRRHGIGPLLIMTVARAVQRPFFIAGLNETVYPMYRRLGFQDHGSLPLYLKVYDPQRLVETMQWPRVAQRVVAGALRVVRPLNRIRRRRSTVSMCAWDGFDNRFDRWWEQLELKRRFTCVVRRTSPTMAWRYGQSPEHQYAIFAAMDGNHVRGVTVVRHGSSRGLPAGFITELLADPDDRDAMDSLLGHAEAHLRATAPEPLVFLRCTMLHRATERALRRAGFLRAPSPIHWMRGPAPTFALPSGVDRRDQWFLSAGDSDLDLL